MTADDLLLAVERHATSKRPQDDLQASATLGFRGEALPSIGAVSRLAITARARDADSAWRLAVEGGRLEGPVPAAHPHGTRVEVRDLFYATPARLKFLRVDRTETEQILDVVNRLAMARSEEHTSELQSLMRISYAVFCLKKKINNPQRMRTNKPT